jgi:hypothetical protein
MNSSYQNPKLIENFNNKIQNQTLIKIALEKLQS